MDQKTGIERALEAFEGSPTRLAAAIGNGVLRQHVEHWLQAKRVPADKCPEVADVTGIPLEDLNDKVNWALVRKLRRRKPSADGQGAATPTEAI